MREQGMTHGVNLVLAMKRSCYVEQKRFWGRLIKVSDLPLESNVKVISHLSYI